MDNLDFNFFCQGCKKSDEYKAENCFTKYRVKNYKRGDFIAFKGERARDISLVTRGTITISIPLASGVIVRSTIHKAQHPLGALALFSSEGYYKADTMANDDCTVIAVAFEDIENQMMKCREFMRSFMTYTTSKIDLFIEQLALLSQRNISAKLAYYIFICAEDGKRYNFTKSIGALAEYLCVERPSLSRIISKFTNEGIITYKSGKGEITNISKLKEYLE